MPSKYGFRTRIEEQEDREDQEGLLLLLVNVIDDLVREILHDYAEARADPKQRQKSQEILAGFHEHERLHNSTMFYEWACATLRVRLFVRHHSPIRYEYGIKIEEVGLKTLVQASFKTAVGAIGKCIAQSGLKPTTSFHLVHVHEGYPISTEVDLAFTAHRQ